MLRYPSGTCDGVGQTMRVEQLLWMSGEEIDIPGEPLVRIHVQLVELAEYTLEQYRHLISMATNRPHVMVQLVMNPDESFVTVVIDHAEVCSRMGSLYSDPGRCDHCWSPIVFGCHTLGDSDYGTYEYGVINNDVAIRDLVAWSPGCNFCDACFSTKSYVASFVAEQYCQRVLAEAGVGHVGKMWINNVGEIFKHVDAWKAAERLAGRPVRRV